MWQCQQFIYNSSGFVKSPPTVSWQLATGRTKQSPKVGACSRNSRSYNILGRFTEKGFVLFSDRVGTDTRLTHKSRPEKASTKSNEVSGIKFGSR